LTICDKNTNDDYKKKYVELCMELDDYSKEGVKKHNKAMKILATLFHQLENDKKVAEVLFEQLMAFDDERVKAVAAAHSLGLNINLNKAQKTLKDIIKSSSEPLSRLNAEMTLQVWMEQGFLKF
jgi:hypothetical protein